MIYLDNAATLQLDSETTFWHNPNTKYAHDSNEFLKQSHDHMKELIGVSSGMIVFGGQNASQLIDLLMAKITRYTKWLTCSPYEHDAIAKYCDRKMKYYDGLKAPLYCHILVNNITGEVFDCEAIGMKQREYGNFFLMDCTSAIGHVQLPNDLEQWCDCIVMSGHKFGGGYMGCMWLSDRLYNELGFKEPSDLASGTPNVRGIVEFIRAFELANKDIDNKNRDMAYLYWTLGQKLYENGITFKDIIGNNVTSCYAINAIRLPCINADALQQYLSSKQIYIGRGASACDSNDDDFRVLQAYGLPKQEESEVIRISFNQWNTIEDIDELVSGIKEFKEKYCT